MYRLLCNSFAKHKHVEAPSLQKQFKYAHLTLPGSWLKANIRPVTAGCFLQSFYTSDFHLFFQYIEIYIHIEVKAYRLFNTLPFFLRDVFTKF